MSVENYTVTTTGIGKVDYSKEVSLGQIRPGVSLKFNQQLRQFVYAASDVLSPYVWIRPLLASGAFTHVYDSNTGLATPFTVPAGYALTLIEQRLNFNQDSEGYLYLDGFHIAFPFLASSGQMVMQSDIAQFSTLQVDPTAALAHQVDLIIYNRGLNNMKGGITITAILEAIGTPPFPTEKDTMCPFCNEINHVGVHVTSIICRKCGNTYFVFDTTGFRRSR